MDRNDAFDYLRELVNAAEECAMHQFTERYVLERDKKWDEAAEKMAGAFDNRPTYEAVEALFQYPYVGNGADVVQRMVDAGLVQPRREEPAWEPTESQVDEVWGNCPDELRPIVASILTYAHEHPDVIGYRKRTEGGRDG